MDHMKEMNEEHDHHSHEMSHEMHHDHEMHQKEMKEDHSSHHSDHDAHMHHMDHGDMGHDMGGMDHSMHMGNFKQKFWLSLVLAIPIIVLSPMMGLELPFQFTFPGSDWVVLILATILFIYGGQPFLSGAKMELKQKNPAMMTLIAMGISVAYIYSLYAFIANHFLHGEHVMDFFWELATLIVIMLLGHWIEMNAVSNAGNALKKLAELLPDTVTRLTKDGEEKVSLQEVKVDDLLIVRAGDKMPTDGIIEKGSTTVDESAVTGESRGVAKEVGAKVIGGSVNGNGTIQVKVTGTGESGYLAKVMEMVRKAQSEKSKLEALSDKVAKWLFYVALAVGLLAFVIWLFVSDLPTALDRMVTVFVIACPHALGLAVPLVVARSTSIAAKNGLLLKNRNALEQAHDLDMILLDKTGTLTQGDFSVTGFEVIDSQYEQKELLKYVGALEASANHPIAIGIMKYLEKQNVTAYSAEDVKNISGVGLEGTVENKKVKIINEKALKKTDSVDPKIIQKYQEQGNTISYLLIDDHLAGLIALGDQIKPEAKTFIKTLKERGIEPVMLTGDNHEAAAAVAEYLGIDKFHGELLPEDKEKIVQESAKDHRVAMVGDGINDAPSLARATVGIAIGAGTDVAIDSADVVLTNSNPEDILHFLDLAKQTRKKMIQNLWWGAGYNILAIPLAAGILAPIGIILNPAVGALLMSLSTIIVAINAMTLKIK
ncbi:heavy metal translocating P-type ATPase [Enterococcus mediterraneensis]|uniref:heavy metal translocating P-type ATPase n=1 Tax=Enterococcus mediterraneensis TaxID=2364791 RepID=UPI000F05B00A|nr:heavy metal translocating P-type ATPase [Enterococcus mediterraneensis]